MTTLADIVNSALSSADESLKLASARDASPATEGGSLAFLDGELSVPSTKVAGDGAPWGDRDTPASKKDDEDDKKDKDKEKKASAREVIADADHAMKLAEALVLGSNIVSAKLASGGRSPLDAPGPQVHESGMQHVPTVPKAHSKVVPTISGPATNAGPNGLPTDKADFTSTGDESGRAQNHPGKTAGWTQSKEASAKVLRAKTAQAEVLMNLGQIDAAQAILDEVKLASEKLAQDPSSPQPSMGPKSANPGALDTEPGPSTHIGDNASLISLTRAQAKDKTTREVSQYISEPPKRDNAVPATQLRTDGQKLSHLVLPGVRKTASAPAVQPKPAETPKTASLSPEVGRAYLRGLIKTASDPEATDAERTKASSALKTIKQRLGVDPEALLA